ncbi:MAG: hypothetical protein LBQ08_05145 [Holosporaceae bacterium]|jgi:hypothetical protein|nr:hypothetical protein [Holosporaceae bacterium]
MKRIIAVLYTIILGMIFVHSESISINESNSESEQEEITENVKKNKKKKSKNVKKNKKNNASKKKKKSKGKKKIRESTEEDSADGNVEYSDEGSASFDEDDESSLKSDKKKNLKKKKKKSTKGKKKKKPKLLKKSDDIKDSDESENDDWKNEQAFNLHDEMRIIDPIIDSSQIMKDSIKIEALPITKLANIEKIKLDKELLENPAKFEISKLEVSKDVDAKIEKLSEKAKVGLEARLESTIATNKLPMQHKNSRPKDGKENVRFRKELEKYRQIYAESLKINSINV